MSEKRIPNPRPDPRTEDIMAGDRRISRPDTSLPDWEMPDTAYRPIPIVWFTGAFLIHLVAVFLIILLFGALGLWVTVTLSALAAGVIGAWTWQRGMQSAGKGWKVATIAILAFNMLFALTASG